MESVVRHWVNMVASEEIGPEGLRRLIQHLSAYFYTNNRLILLMRSAWIQWTFCVFTYPFDCFPLCMNVRKMVRMVWQPCHSPGYMLVEAFTRRMAGGEGQRIEIGCDSGFSAQRAEQSWPRGPSRPTARPIRTWDRGTRKFPSPQFCPSLPGLFHEHTGHISITSGGVSGEGNIYGFFRRDRKKP